MTPEFRAIFFNAGGLQIECVCGRTNFGERGRWDWDEGEYERLEALAEEKPDQYVYHVDADGVRAGEGLTGGPVVEDCPCGEAERIETFWWDRAATITSYLKARAKREAEAVAAQYLGGSSALEALQDLAKLKDEAERRSRDAHQRLIGEPLTPR